jgi:DNA-binding MarR family transcriptional regulator
MSDVPIRVDKAFAGEFPGASRSATEAGANLVHTATLFLDELNRRRATLTSLSPSACQVLAVLDGAGEPLPSNTIAERLLITTASMTSLLDTLERRGMVRRGPHPTDRRKILVSITPKASALVDEMLPVIYGVQAAVFAPLSAAERRTFIELLARIQRRIGELVDTELPAPAPRRRRVS